LAGERWVVSIEAVDIMDVRGKGFRRWTPRSCSQAMISDNLLMISNALA
jgi:hypothetical protein